MNAYLKILKSPRLKLSWPRRHHWHRAGLIAACVLVFALTFAIGAFLRVLVGPVSLDLVNGTLASSVSNALPGLKVRYDEAALEWSREEGRINLVVLGARVFDDKRRIIAQAPKAEIGLGAGAFFRGHIKVKRIALVGVQLNFVRMADGRLRLGVENDNGNTNALDRIRDAINRGQGGSSLQSFAVRHARLAFYDESSHLFVVAPDASLQFSSGNTLDGALIAAVNAQVEVSGNRAQISGELRLPPIGPTTGDIAMKGLNLSALAANTKALSMLAPFNLATDISGSFTLDGARLVYADFAAGATGNVTGLGPKPLPVKSLRVVGRYDGKTGRLLIDDGTLAGSEVQAHLQGEGDVAFGPDNRLSAATLDITMDKVVFDVPAVTNKTVDIARANLRAAYSAADNSITVSRAAISGGAFQAEFAGKVTLAGDASPGIDADGHIAPLGVRDLLHYWPLKAGAGAREWIDANVAAGRIGPVEAHVHIKPGELDQPVLPDADVSVSFPLSGATITYVSGLDPLTNVSGTAQLSGDNFRGEIASANVGRISVGASRVVIPDLHLDTNVADITAHISGGLPDVLALIDEKPLQYPSRFHMRTQGARGDVEADLSFHVPTKHDVSIDEVGISVKTTVSGLAIALGEHTRITDGIATFVIDNNSLHAAGPVMIGGVQMNVDWTETFKDTPITTRVTARGVMDNDARDAFGFRLGDFIDGPVGVNALLLGRRGQLQTAQATLDLTQASVGYDLINYKKPPGTQAGGTANAKFAPDGSVRSATFQIGGPGLTARGTAMLDANGDLVRLDAPVVKAGPANDFAITLVQGPTVGLTIAGRSFDGSALGKHNPGVSAAGGPARPQPMDSNDPFHASVKVDRLVLQEGVVLTPFDLELSGLGHRPQAMSLSATQTKNDKVQGSLTTDSSGRKVTLTADDAGLLLKGLFGMESVRGGTLSVTVKLPPMAEAARNDAGVPDYTGTLTLKDIRVLNQPFLTRLFTAGSLEGFVNLMRGEGVVLDKAEVPFTTHGDVIDVHDARASGPSIGITADGYLDRRTSTLALKGAVAPAYGLNSVLGAIPLLGDVLVSKKGEGILGMTYNATGSFDSPDVSMNPLSVLAPGILRRIFEGRTPSAPSQANSSGQPPEKQPDRQPQ
ncbi:MAG TPA: AsmA-like C-terminal domain-containing protein [Rhizomicrobium sp.]|nr:AsmA-like C-terminal domain-containing protein [Rhizomicrobium sp.]